MEIMEILIQVRYANELVNVLCKLNKQPDLIEIRFYFNGELIKVAESFELDLDVLLVSIQEQLADIYYAAERLR
jgi:hypothetical protein